MTCEVCTVQDNIGSTRSVFGYSIVTEVKCLLLDFVSLKFIEGFLVDRPLTIPTKVWVRQTEVSDPKNDEMIEQNRIGVKF